MKKDSALSLTIIPMFAALTAILSQIAIPIGPVPVNLSLVSVFLSAAILSTHNAVISQVIYILLGVIGVPVFTSFNSGIQALVGPTGGYIIGYIPCVLITGMLIQRFGKKFIGRAISMLLGLASCYALGTAWFMRLTQTPAWSALTLCVFPFLIADAIKIIFATIISLKIKNKISTEV